MQYAAAYKETCKAKGVRLLGDYTTALTKTLHLCLACGNKWLVKPNDINNSKPGNNRCAECRRRKIHEWKRTPFKVYKAGVEAKDNVKVLSREFNFLQIKCLKCKEKFKAPLRGRKHECPKCKAQDIIDRIEAWGKVKVIKALGRKGDKKRFEVECLTCHQMFVSRRQELRRGNGCQECGKRLQFISLFKTKPFQLGEREVRVQGYEPLALKYLMAKGVKPNQIRVAQDVDCPVITMPSGKHYPDIYVPHKNLIVEVKSKYTFGLARPTRNGFPKNQLKSLCAKEQGYDYRMWLFDGKGNPIVLPKDWEYMTRRDVKRYINKRTSEGT